MAIDSEDKRRSALSFSPALLILPVPDGAALSAADRKHVGFCYRGIAAGSVSTEDDHNFATLGIGG